MGNIKLKSDMIGRAGILFDYFMLNKKFGRFFSLWFFSGMLLLLLIAASAAHGGAALSSNEKKVLSSEGAEFFHEAAQISESDPAAARDLYSKALIRFERLVDEGNVKNGKLYYNIGNIYFLLDDIGRAILNYRRAEQYIPNDPNLGRNLAYARSIRQDKLETRDQEKILQTLFFFHYDLGVYARLILFGMAYVSFWIFAVIRIFTRRPFTSWGLGVTLVFILLFGGSLFVENRQSTMNHAGVILAPEVVGRQGDANSYQQSFEEPLHAGTEFTRLDERGAWWRIELPDGRTSWIPAVSGELVRKG